jgi:UDP-N-acetylglucosamine--N-acetylmuramyl-(pentapeptide) pyrophosphoryl-undecaprenol N-acetylglucosamine transferase
MQVVHVSGALDWPAVQANQESLAAPLAAERYRPYPYLHDEMGAAFAAADLVICRAGASTLGELPAYGLPAILVPYPHAWRYQYVNAGHLARQGAAEILADQDLGTRLLPLVRQLMGDKDRLSEMRRAMRSLARPQAASAIAGLLHSFAGAAQRTAFESGNKPKG